MSKDSKTVRFNSVRAQENLRTLGARKFKDIITNSPARSEIEFSCALAVLHSWALIDWSKVRVRSIGKSSLDSSVNASDLIFKDSIALCEYPLFAERGSSEERKWGGYRGDVLFVSPDKKNIAYVENKIGASASPDIIAGTIECLGDGKHSGKASFILLTGQEFLDAKWYEGELMAALWKLDTKQKSVRTHIMVWEDVLNACDDL